MEKCEITITLDREHLEALEFYLKKENTGVQKCMDEALRQLYERSVPEPVREYLDRKAAPERPRRPRRSGQMKQEQHHAQPPAKREEPQREQ